MEGKIASSRPRFSARSPAVRELCSEVPRVRAVEDRGDARATSS